MIEGVDTTDDVVVRLKDLTILRGGLRILDGINWTVYETAPGLHGYF